MKVRLQKFMADCGVASRRECEAIITAGRVRVNGEVRTLMPVMVDPEKDQVMIDQEIVEGGSGLKLETKVYYLLNKPKGVLVTNYDPDDRKTVGEYMKGIEERVFPVGRLDMDARGALIMTNDGELVQRLTHPKHGVEKTYIVEVDGRLGPGEVEKIKRGVWLGPDVRRGAPVVRQGATKSERFKLKILGRERGRTILEVRIAEGKNREIRRVMARVGHTVRDLNRVAIAGRVTTKSLPVGKIRPLTQEEVAWLWKASSPEFHEKKTLTTQQWYEQKEMEKERKRLAVEGADESRKSKVETQNEGADRKRPERKERPERKGKKPFVPPSGRNAGKILGGDMLGRKRADVHRFAEELDGGNEEIGNAKAKDEMRNAKPKVRNEPAEHAEPTPHVQHPLGSAVRREDD